MGKTKRPERRGTSKVGVGKLSPRPLSEDLLRRLPVDVRKQLEGLRAHDKAITDGLKSKEMTELFLRDPVAALRKLKIPIPVELAARVGKVQEFGALLSRKTFQLPNGRSVTPNVNIRIVGVKEA